MPRALNQVSESLTPKDYDQGIRIAVKIAGRIYKGKPAEQHAELATRILGGVAWHVPSDQVITGFIAKETAQWGTTTHGWSLT